MNKATNEVIKDWGPANPMVMYNLNNPFAGVNPTQPTDSGGQQLTGEDWLNAQGKLSPAQKTLIRGTARYEIDPNSSKTRGVPASTLIAMAKMYNPKYDQTQYGTKSAVRKDFTSGTSSKVIRNLNTATGHLDQLTQAIDALNNSDFPKLNSIANELGFQVGSNKMTNFDTIKNAVDGELSSIYKGTGAATDAEIEKVGGKVRASGSPDQLMGNVNEAIHLMGSRLASMKFQYETGMDNPADFQLVSPASQKVFGKYGVNVPQLQKPMGSSQNKPVATNPLQQKYQQSIPGIVFPNQ